MSKYTTTLKVSIHVPARGTTEMDLPSARGSSVSIHVPARGTTKNGSAVVSQIMFQSTFPQGERQRKEKKYEHTDSFNPRSRKGNDDELGILWGLYNKFQSTFPQGERPRKYFLTIQSRCFNPRSRKGNDGIPVHLLQLVQKFQSTFPQGERQS